MPVHPETQMPSGPTWRHSPPGRAGGGAAPAGDGAGDGSGRGEDDGDGPAGADGSTPPGADQVPVGTGRAPEPPVPDDPVPDDRRTR